MSAAASSSAAPAVLLERPAPRGVRIALSVLTLAVASILLFARLGHYALWDDEAITALTAQGVLKTGDTSAILGHNILAYRNGLLLRGTKDRATPPLQFYVVAPFLAMCGNTALAARLPFAICGLACVGLILWSMHRDDASTLAWIFMSLGIFGNVSLFLFFRQSRYYGLAMLLSVAIAYSYLHNRSRGGLIVHAVLSVLLLAANYMAFAALTIALALDYVFWGRKRRRLRTIDWLILLGPQVVAGVIILSIWNPLRIASDGAKAASLLTWKLQLLWWNLRDLNSCEFGVGALLLAMPIVWFFTRCTWLLRAAMALVVLIVVITIISPQPPSNTRVADVRYLAFLIPLCIAIGVVVLLELAQLSWPAAVALGLVAFGSNALHGTPLWNENVKFRSTIVSYAKELATPLSDPITPVAHWIRENVGDGDSVLIAPPHMMYPLMFHAPNAIYAWQLSSTPPAGLEHLPAIHTGTRIAPDYLIAFGPWVDSLSRIQVETSEPLNYTQVGKIEAYWDVAYRPELFWHRFQLPREPDQRSREIVIFKRVTASSNFRL